MKLRLFPLLPVSLAAAAWLAAVPAHAQQAADGATRAGIAKTVRGQVNLVGTRGQRSLQPGDPVSVADRVVTGSDGVASMVLRDGTTMVVGSNSQFELRNFAYDSTTQSGNMAVSLLRGTMRMITGLIGKSRPEAVAFTTPTATIGIRGTDFIVQVDDVPAVQ